MKILEKFLLLNGNILRHIPIQFRTDKIYQIALENNCDLEILPKEMLTPEFREKAVQHDSKNLLSIPWYMMTRKIIEISEQNNHPPQTILDIERLKEVLKENEKESFQKKIVTFFKNSLFWKK